MTLSTLAFGLQKLAFGICGIEITDDLSTLYYTCCLLILALQINKNQVQDYFSTHTSAVREPGYLDNIYVDNIHLDFINLDNI